MFTQNDLRTLLNSKPFTPFRLWLSDGGHIDIRSPEVASPGKHYAIVWVFDPNQPDKGFDSHSTIWYMHVTRHQALQSGDSPFQTPGDTPPGTPAQV